MDVIPQVCGMDVTYISATRSVAWMLYLRSVYGCYTPGLWYGCNIYLSYEVCGMDVIRQVCGMDVIPQACGMVVIPQI